MRKGKILSFILIFMVFSSYAQTDDFERARRLHQEYKFDQAAALFEKLLSSATDKAEKDRIFSQMILSENGKSLLMYSSEPQTVAKKMVPRKDFFLWYSHLKDRSWTPEGNYFPAGEDRYFYSEKGNIYVTSRKDSSLWSAPEIPSPEMESEGEEIFPMLSPDGKELFFSSNALFGMGGYDLFVCRWDDDAGKWGPVQNAGFPFSSTADDFLYTYTPDNNYIVFASNRDCDKDHVVIYVVRYENFLRKMVSQDEARDIARMKVEQGETGGFEFSRHTLGSRPVLNQEQPEPEIDYTFRTGEKTSYIVEDNTLPRGIVYQVRIMVSNARVKNAQLKGFSPVFEVKQPSGKYIYYVGLFKTYKDVSAALKKVKTKIPGAYAVAFENGKPLQIAKAREKESKVTVVSEEVRIVSE